MPLKNNWQNGDTFTPAAANDIANAVNSAVVKGELVLNFADYGACNGSTNDRAALATALSVLASAGGGTLLLPPKTIAITPNANPTVTIPGNVSIVGTPGVTTISLTSADTSTDFVFAGTSGDNVIIDGVKFVRNSDIKLVLFAPGAVNGFHLNRCIIDGRVDTYPTNYVNGISFDYGGNKSNITMKGCTVTKVRYALLQANATTYNCDTVVVDDCTFTQNYRDDVMLNAPNSTVTNVAVLNSRFYNNAFSSAGAGFGVDLAHVTGAVVRDCHFENYYNEAIHVEDYSTNVVIANNRLVSCGTTRGGGILVITGCSNITIAGNVIDARSNTVAEYGIIVLMGGAGTTPGGRPHIAPSQIHVSDNLVLCGSSYSGIYVENVSDALIQGNRFIGAGTVTAGVWNAGNTKAGIYIDGVRTAIQGNTVSGFYTGVRGPMSVRNALGNPGTVGSNTVSDCYIGILGITIGAVNITGNTLTNCVRPLIVGEGNMTAQPCTVTGNFATGCVYEMEIDGKLILARSAGYSSVATGSERTIFVQDVWKTLPVGTVINFSGGGVLTLTTAVTAVASTSTALVGNVTSAAVGASSVGTTVALPHSATAGNNFVMVTGNTDTAAGVYEIGSAEIASTLAGKTLTGATLSSPVINTPTGIVKGDVGLGNVDNTSNVSERAATAALTNKDLTSATNTFPTFNQNTTGTAAALSTSRNFQTDLASTTATGFTGAADNTHGVTGTLAVGNGGTGVTTVTGLVKGNGTSAMTAAVAGTDFVAPSGALGTPTSGTLTNCDGLPASGVIDPDDLTTGESTLPRRIVFSSAVTGGNSVLRLTYFTAKKTETITQVRTITGTTAGVTPTLCRIGIYSVAGNGNLTLEASTANDTALWVAANTAYTKSLSASFTKTKGQRYAVALLVVGAATAPTFYGNALSGSEMAFGPRLSGFSNQTDLVSSLTEASISASGSNHYVVLLP